MKKLLELAALLKPGYCPDWYHFLLADLLQRCAQGDQDVPNLLWRSEPDASLGVRFPFCWEGF